ncbi:hypothetical protein ALC53_02111 [Atta colombica]|uniref:Uncharacterized protein n=1 Tax=Atta colombica TaxID=520822 RepID=A0A195BTP9_9HYME|nr:hypothetical protein ALC53_02111 [Atta colombica]
MKEKKRREKVRKRRREEPSASLIVVVVSRDSVARRGTSDRVPGHGRAPLYAAPPILASAMPGPRADQYFGSDTRRGGRGRVAPKAVEPWHEASRVPPLRAALPAQSLCGSGRRGMCGIVTASVIEE